MDYKNERTTIGEVVATLPAATDIFRQFEIDFCCGGHRALSEVIRQQGINEQQLYSKLEQAQQQRKDSYQEQKHDFMSMSPEVLSAYIEDTHHSYLRKVLPQAMELLNTILRVHGKNHRELFELYSVFGQLKTELEQHLLKEETMVFPELGHKDENLDTITTLTNEIINEHEAAGELLRRLKELTNDYQAPSDGCGTYEKTYQLLEEIEKDIHQHIHLENNILLKKYAKR